MICLETFSDDSLNVASTKIPVASIIIVDKTRNSAMNITRASYCVARALDINKNSAKHNLLRSVIWSPGRDLDPRPTTFRQRLPSRRNDQAMLSRLSCEEPGRDVPGQQVYLGTPNLTFIII